MTDLEDAAREAGLGTPAPRAPAIPEPEPLSEEEQAVADALADRTIDLDAARRARRSKRGKQPKIRFLSVDYPLPYELPADVLDMVDELERGDFTAVTAAFRSVLGGPVYDKVKQAAIDDEDPLTVDDVTFLLEKSLEVYEVKLPE